MMRIVGGKFARRMLVAPEGITTRPTSDRAREAVFNILQHQDWGRNMPQGRAVLDVCCGTGAMALEALSRGAAQAWLLENDTAALQAARRNIQALGVQSYCHLLRADAVHPPPAAQACDLIFCDPPYRRHLPAAIIPALAAADWFAPGAVLVLETARGETPPPLPAFTLTIQRDYGAATVRFYRFG